MFYLTKARQNAIALSNVLNEILDNNSYNEKGYQKFRKKFIIRYIEHLDLSNDKEATTKYKIAYKDKFYNILGINNLEERDEILELVNNKWL